MADATIQSILKNIRQKLASDDKTILVIPDLHDNPEERKDRFKWIACLATDRNVDHVVCLGDAADVDSLCGHVANHTLDGKTKPAFVRELESLALAFETFRRHYKPTKPASLHMTIGNHEHRIWRFENENPEVAGAFSGPYTDLLEAFGWNYVMFGDYITIEGVNFTHRPLNGMGKPFGGQNAAQAVAREALADTVFGDSHKLNVATKAKVGGGNTMITVLEAGCALEWGKVKGYARNSMTGWWWGVHILTCSNGIRGIESIPMYKLERLYG